MSDLISRFMDVMRDEYVLHEELLRLSEEKREAIVEGSLPKLDGIVREEQMRIAKQREMEKRRIACVEELARLTGKPVGEITMLTFTEQAEPEQGGQLRQLAEKLSDTLNKLKKNNDINIRMIEGRLEYIQCMVSSVSALQESNVYSARGTEQKRQEQAAKLYDKKV